jgi:hypothetical protein
VTDEHEPLARDARDEVVEVGAVVEEVVIAAGADPVGVAVTTQIGRDDVRVLGEAVGDLAPAVAEIEKAVNEDERRVAGTVPVERVIRQAGRERDPSGIQGPASM